MEALIENGVADELRALVLARPQEAPSDPLWLAAYDELARSTESLAVGVVQTMPAFRSLLLSLTSES